MAVQAAHPIDKVGALEAGDIHQPRSGTGALVAFSFETQQAACTAGAARDTASAMSQENVEIVRQNYEQLNETGTPALDSLDSEVEFDFVDGGNRR